MKKPAKANKFQLTMITIVIVGILVLSLTAPDFVQAGFTPTPQPPTNTPAPPVNTRVPPTVAPTRRPKKKKKSSNQPAAAAAEVTPEPTPSPPLPATGSVEWQPTMILLLWAASLPLALPMIGSLKRRKRKSVPPQPSKIGGKHDRAGNDV